MKHVYFFGNNRTEGKKELKNLLGGKGANLAEMANIGVPVPPGFTITTETCEEYNNNNGTLPDETKSEILEHLKALEQAMGASLGSRSEPLLLSVRSGAAQSMPGMMDTILNLGLNDEVVKGLAEKTGNERFAWDSYRRLLQMFGDVVLGVKASKFEHVLEQIKETKGVHYDKDLDVENLKQAVAMFKTIIKDEAGEPFPQDALEQLFKAIDAVFGSWNNERAIAYRRLNNITGLKGTAVNVQAMVFGNMGETSGTGVAFTRDPSTGENVFYGEYLMNAQGEDVVAGIRTPKPITTLKDSMPEVYEQLETIYKKLENHYKDMQDLEFTIQEGKLYMLQTRNGKRTAHAAVKIAADMVDEGLIDERTAVLRVDPKALDQLLHQQLDKVAKDKHETLGKGLPASPGAAVGKIAFSNDAAVKMKEAGENVILVRNDTSPEDLIGMDAAKGILTAKGGMTSHAAVVARGMGKCCISGCGDAVVDETAKTVTFDSETFNEGDSLSLDGTEGTVYKGQVPTVDPDLSGSFAKIMQWADKHRTMKVRTNAETPRDAKKALEFGAQGIGLCRTEHMFFEGERIKAVREMILSETKEKRKEALEKIKPFQKDDFKQLFGIMDGKPITIRLLDPPLHEFMPKDKDDIKQMAHEQGVSEKKIHELIEKLEEVNPMLGHRGCRLGITYPEITEMQSEAIFEAAREVAAAGDKVEVEVMIPLIGNVKEFENQGDVVKRVAESTISTSDAVSYNIGTMIEVPRAALTADKVAEAAEFFSFGTNDLTQMTLGISRDDAGKFIPGYIDKQLLEYDPFQVLDQTGVGQLVETAVQKGRRVNDKLKLGICGEHGGEPSSVEFCHRVGLDYVSCSPYRVPIARLAAAHAKLKEE
ncbi:MAG: pyruvate, phosphate dikinase [Candidatus Woesearchaeota archaeon]